MCFIEWKQTYLTSQISLLVWLVQYCYSKKCLLNIDFMKIIFKLSKCNCEYSPQSLLPFALYRTRSQKLSLNTTSLWKDCLFWTVGLCPWDGQLLVARSPGRAWGPIATVVQGDFAYKDSDCALCFFSLFLFFPFIASLKHNLVIWKCFLLSKPWLPFFQTW